MNDIIINMNNTKQAEGSDSLEVGDLKPTEASEKPGIDVKLDESTSDVAAKPEDVSKDEEKSAEALSADEKAPVKVKAEASPETEDSLNNTDSTETAEEMAETVSNETDDYVTEGGEAKADDSSSAIKTERESEEPMNEKMSAVQARKSILMKLAVASCRKRKSRNGLGKRGKTELH